MDGAAPSETSIDPLSKKQLINRWQDLLSKRSNGWDTTWRERADYLAPRRIRIHTTDTNDGRRKDQSIINSRPVIAARTLRAQLVTGMSSPANRWFVGTASDPELKEDATVIDFAFAVEEKIREALKKSNVYQGLAALYGDTPIFGTGCIHIEDDLEEDVRAYVQPIGSYVIDAGPTGEIDTVMNEERLTTKKLVEKFGIENCSQKVQDEHKAGRYGTEFDVVHAILPNPDYVPDAVGPAGMQFASRWFELTNSATDDGKFLKEGGYYEMPTLTPRWAVTGCDTWGSDCPGEHAIGDVKILQRLERRQAQAFDKVTNPPMVQSGDVVGEVDLSPGGVTINPNGQVKVEPIVKIDPAALQRFHEKIQEVERRVDSAFYADLTLQFQSIEGRMTATEVVARQQEVMQLLGEAMERFEKELLRPLLHRVFMVLYRAGKLPPIPDVLKGRDLKWDFLSSISQAQKIRSTANIERFLSLVGNLKAAAPDVLDKVDLDQAVDEYASAVAVPPSLVRSDDEVAEIRKGRAAVAQKQAAQQDLAAQVEGAKVLSETDTGGDNALTRMLGNATGAAPSTANPAGS